MKNLRRFLKTLPTLLTAFILALAVWIMAVTSNDPTEEREYPNQIAIEVIGLDNDLVSIDELPDTLTLQLSAPQSVWDRLESDDTLVRAVMDFSGLAAGEHIVTIQVQIGVTPVRVLSQSPEDVVVVLEEFATRQVDVHLDLIGDPGTGFEAGIATIDPEIVTISGPRSRVDLVDHVQAVFNLNGQQENISESMGLTPMDIDGQTVAGVEVTPDEVLVDLPIVQLGGYRNVVVRVNVTGQLARGYRLTNITVAPAVITVFSADPQLVENLPGYIETMPLDITGLQEDTEVNLSLNLPTGITAVGSESVLVQVGIASIEGSITFNDLTVEIINLPTGLVAEISPQWIDVILSGPLPLLEEARQTDIQVVVNAQGLTAGTYQLEVEVILQINNIQVDSVLPSTVEVVLTSTTQP
ncbi:MAG TPA: CdaR family protein [Longilinea sp.]|nr:CdaR family protein [Longilinea sp.]